MQPQTERRRRITLLFGDEPANLIALETILDSMAASVWALRPTGEVGYGNRHWWDYSGLPATESDASACLEVIHPDDRAAVAAHFRAALRDGEEFETRCRLRRADDGAYRWHIVRTLPVEGVDRAVTGCIAVATDIHDMIALTAEVPGTGQDVNVRRMRALLRDGPMPILMFEGVEHRCVFLNAATEALLDREVLGRVFRDAFPEMSDRLLPVLDQVYRTGEPFAAREFPVTIEQPHRVARAFDLAFQPARDATGKVFGILLAGVDVTAQVEARREIERHADRLARLQEVAAALADVLDPVLASDIVVEHARTALGASSCAVALLDDPRRTLEAVASSAPPETRGRGMDRIPVEAVHPTAQAVRTGDPVVLESRAAALSRFPDLKSWLEETGSEGIAVLPLLGQGGTFGALTLTFASQRVFDASEWDFAETLARQCGDAIERARLYRVAQTARMDADLQRERLRSLIQEAPAPMAVCRGDAHVVELANPSWLRLFRQENDVIGRPARDAFPALERHGFLAIFDHALRSGEPVAVSEASLHLERGDGTLDEVVVNVTAQPQTAPSHAGGVIVVANDVTDQVRARRRLEHEVAARAASERERVILLEQEKETRARAETANRAKDEFLAMLGHELRNPLAPIVTALQLMKMRGAPQSRELTIVERQVQHLVRLVDDLLDVSRITRGSVQLKKQIVEIGAVIGKALEMASPLLEQRNHHLTLDVPQTGLCVEADATRLAQVVANLLTNAAKYTDPGGHVSVSAAREDDRIVVRVKDDGIGIPRDLLPAMFDLFVQGVRALDRSEGGLGIGLTLARSLAALHGGVLEAHSEGPGRGSEFVVRLPALAPVVEMSRLADESAPLMASAAEAARGRVLIVDDNVDAADLLAQLVRSAGFEVATAHDGPQALALAARFSPNVAVLDIGLPVMDGFELARRLRSRPEGRFVRLIAVTGYGQQHDRDNSRAAGFEEHLVKPVDARALLAAIEPPQA